ncbi:MAG TPA: ParA family protein [Ktedonobacterales bacterium]|nr:ParA family protein [Ktedonobacterales bacterium]
MRILALCNNKGGVTKTTTTINLAYGLARTGRQVLVLDMDAQCNATFTLSGHVEHQPSLFDVLMSGTKLADVIQPTKESRLHLAPSSIDLAAADVLMAAMPGREQKLKRAMRGLEGYDYILIDTPPNLGVLTLNAFVACTDVIIPLALTTYTLIGIAMLENGMQEMRENLDIELPVLGLVANLDDHTRVSAEVLATIREQFGGLLFESVIPRNIRVEEAHKRGECLFDFAPTSTGAKAYASLVQEVIARVEK